MAHVFFSVSGFFLLHGSRKGADGVNEGQRVLTRGPTGVNDSVQHHPSPLTP